MGFAVVLRLALERLFSLLALTIQPITYLNSLAQMKGLQVPTSQTLQTFLRFKAQAM